MSNEKRLIDANALMEQFDDSFKGFVMKRIVEMQPTVDAVEVVHGRWIERSNGVFDCSVCTIVTVRSIPIKGVNESELWNYCPNCGAKMDGDGNG